MRKIWTQAEIDIVVEMYPDHYTRDIADRLQRTPSSIYQAASSLRLKKSDKWRENDRAYRAELLARTGEEFRFKKGQIPPNKGKKMSDEVYEKVYPSCFKKGHEPANTLYHGAITIRHEKSGRPYKYIRISNGVWKPYHQFIWEQERGKVPPRHCLWFKDGDSLNCVVENLEVITRGENAIRNKFKVHLMPKEIEDVIRMKIKLNKKIKEHTKNGSKKQTNRPT